MRRTILVCLLVTASAGAPFLLSASGEAAPPKPQDNTPAPSVPSLATMMEGFHFGVSHVEITRLYNQVNGIFDKEYNPRLAKMQPGVAMQAVESERDTRKMQFANNIIEFKDTPIFDGTGLKGEFAYKNHESVQTIDGPGYRRLFFYMGAPPGDRFWKMYTEYKLFEGGPMGKTYPECVQRVTAMAGGNGRARNPEPDKWLLLPYTEWQDATTHLRVINRSGEGICGVALEELSVYSTLKSHRPASVDDPMALDPSVAAITRGGITDPNAKPQPGQGGDAGTKGGNKKK